MKENKELIVDKLLEVLRLTRELSDLICLEYLADDKDNELVIATFNTGYSKVVNVSMDSGIAMISDIVKGLRWEVSYE